MVQDPLWNLAVVAARRDIFMVIEMLGT